MACVRFSSRRPARLAIALAAGIAAASAHAQQIIWNNINTFPQDLINTGDGWSAIRVAEISSLRCAADDFTLTTRTRLTSLEYYSAYARGTPTILGADVYIYAAEGNLPGALLRALPDRALNHQDSGLVSPIFGTIYRNVVSLENIELDAGRYFIAFRTVQTFSGNEARNAVLTTRIERDATGVWNFGVLQNGGVSEAWSPLTIFNLQPNNAWTFLIRGIRGCPADFNQNGTLDFFDYLDFVAAFDANLPSADFNANGTIDFFDYLDFVAAFDAGCD